MFTNILLYNLKDSGKLWRCECKPDGETKLSCKVGLADTNT